MRGMTIRTEVGTLGMPPTADTYSGTPTQVNSRPSCGWPRNSGSRLSTKVMPRALARRA